MKKLILFLTFFTTVFLSEVKASHFAGGEIVYRYIGDSTGVPHQYLVSVRIYRGTQGNPLGPNAVNLDVTNSCALSHTLADWHRITPPAGWDYGDGGAIIPTLDECVNDSSENYLVITKHIWEGILTLDGPCPDWRFSIRANARNSEIDNLQDPGTKWLYVDAILNNTKGDNSSPDFITPAAKSFCRNQPFIWSQATIEPDGDSLKYRFAHPLDDYGVTIPYATGYSLQDPMHTKNGIQVDSANGSFRFEPVNIETVVIKVVVDEFRYDPNLNQWYLVGNATRDLQIPVVDSCKASTAGGPKIDITSGNFISKTYPGDSLKGFKMPTLVNDSTFNSTTNSYDYDIPTLIGYSCYDSLITLEFDIDVNCESITPTDFRVLGLTDTVPRPVPAVVDHCRPDLTTRTVDLLLEKPLDLNGKYLVYIKRGNDGNTLQNRCGFELKPYYAIMIDVKDCPPLIYNVENVTVVEDEDIRIDWDIEPDYFARGAYKVFTGWQVIKRLKGTQDFYGVTGGLIRDIDARSYLDTVVTAYQVDRAQFEYGVQLFQNGYDMPPTGIVASILLTEDVADNTSLELNWTEYTAWNSPVYQLYVGKYDTSSQTADWKAEGPADKNYYNYTYALPPPDSVSSNLYYVKVEALDSLSPFVAESNWIYFGVLPPDPEPENPVVGPPVVPNVITPNGDNVNDRFYVSSEGKEYETVQVTVYNRWGQLVFEDDNFSSRNTASLGWDGTDMNSGQKLSDGVYYYIIKMNDPTAEENKQLQGMVTLLSSGTN